MSYLDAGKKSIANKGYKKNKCSKGKPVEESSEDENSEDESSDEVFCVV